MTFTPDRKRRKSGKRDRRAAADSRSGASRRPPINSNPADLPDLLPRAAQESADNASGQPEVESPHPASLAEQLKAAGLDLSGHYLAEMFDALDPVSTDDSASTDDPVSTDGPLPTDGKESREDTSAPAAEQPTEAVEPAISAEAEPNAQTDSTAQFESNEQTSTTTQPETVGPANPTTAGGHSTVPVAAQPEAGGDSRRPASQHPILTDAAWNDLAASAPEITDSIASLNGLVGALRAFDRPMGPSEALQVIDGAEALRRLSESLSTLALAVYERVGTPTDSGAKSTKALIQERLNLSGREANRRARLAENLGGRVALDGQPLEPEHPLVAEQLHLGTLPAEHLTVIEDCLKALPAWVDQETKSRAEADLVKYAASVTVSELRDIFRQMLALIDPDGVEPLDPSDRSAYFVTARPKRNGDWRLEGVLDPVAGSELHGLLTSRIQSAKDNTSNTAGAEPTNAEAASADGEDVPAIVPNAGPGQAPGEERFEPIDAVLTGDRFDAPPWAVVEAAGETEADTADSPADRSIPAGHGVRADGATVDLMSEQPGARVWIYERFATLISRISMKEAAKGSPYALVVTAKASDIADGTGEATTGSGDRFPMSDITRRGLNGTVFFHLMDEKARTVEVRTDQRFANKKQTAIVTARDRGCVFPGCDAPAGWCDVNHVAPHARGGETDINNMCLLCSFHHHLMDRSDWEVRMLADGRPAWRPPESIDPARALILHSRFITDDIIDGLFGT
ncbi:HNH endonuclease signature motif containing protein [Brevibacterium sp. CFH 10365]|uniref:HNH endonuclease signature motif containing protein n=1 Tax=Brevibacterium sp. CFH 10365 TaxID=2585207 RepID=UPI00126678B4|nr:HNH endonuclease signature motif containing protein [Brevibacterium sp. CFH 10365]